MELIILKSSLFAVIAIWLGSPSSGKMFFSVLLVQFPGENTSHWTDNQFALYESDVFIMVFSMGTQNCTSRFHNLSTYIPILTWDTSMNLWLNSLTIWIRLIRLIEGPNFDPFSCLIFAYFQWFSVYEPKTALLDSITWVIRFRF